MAWRLVYAVRNISYGRYTAILFHSPNETCVKMHQLYQLDDLFILDCYQRLQALILQWSYDGTSAHFVLKQPIAGLLRLHGRRTFLLRLGRATFLLPIGVYSYNSFYHLRPYICLCWSICFLLVHRETYDFPSRKGVPTECPCNV